MLDRADEPELMQIALARSSDDEVAMVLRIVLGFTGYTARERLSALAAVGTSWWKERRSWRSLKQAAARRWHSLCRHC